MSKEDMAYSVGVMPSISSMIRCLTDVGDEILIQTPVYHVFFYVIEENDRKVLENELIYENGEYSTLDIDASIYKLPDNLIDYSNSIMFRVTYSKKNHKVYDVIKAPMNIKSRMDVKKYMTNISSGKSTQLKNLTSNYHYHTITADNTEILDMIQQELANKGFLAKLQDYEPVDFWNN